MLEYLFDFPQFVFYNLRGRTAMVMHTLWSRRSVCLAFALSGCAITSRPRSYLDLPVATDGSPRQNPYIVRLERKDRSLLLLGVVHTRDPNAPLFGVLEREFIDFAPDILIHENQAPSELDDRNKSISSGGDIGFVTHLAHKRGVPYVSGDLSEDQEFPLLASRGGVEPALVFLTAQRLITGMNGDLSMAASEYQGFYEEYLVANKFPRREQHATWKGFSAAFERVQKRPLYGREWDYEIASPLREHGPLNVMSRLSHRLRDDHLLDVIAKKLALHKRILVVFGAWHVLAIEPVVSDPVWS